MFYFILFVYLSIFILQIYAPLLIKDEKWGRTFDPKLQSLLSELQAGLRSQVQKSDPSQGGKVQADDRNFAGKVSCEKKIRISWFISFFPLYWTKHGFNHNKWIQ